MHLEYVEEPFSITYRSHWCGSCRKYEDTKEEATIADDGKVTIRRYDHHGTKGSYRVIERATAHVSPDDVL